MRRAKIIATLGPASNSPERVAGLVRAGVDAFRINCSHASLEDLAHDVRLVRRTAEELRKPVAVLLDLQGPRLRTGRLKGGGPVKLEPGKHLKISIFDQPGDADTICTNYRDLPNAVHAGGRILLDDGSLELRVLKPSRYEVDCEVVVGGLLKENKGLNVPGATIGLPTLTAKDRRDLDWGLALGADYFGLSFVRKAQDVLDARARITAKRSHAEVIAKIEREEAVENLDAIVEASDGIMVARGDLASELTPAEVPVLQKRLIQKANERGRMVIVATQMLESMITHQQPTRAEASDVANAIFDGTDAVMLSGETAVGLHPELAVRTMASIVRRAESSNFVRRLEPMPVQGASGYAYALSRAATAACVESHAKAVVVFTMTGWSARIMAKYRPIVPIFALAHTQMALQQLALSHNITPIHCPIAKHTDAMLRHGERILIQRGVLKKGDVVILMAGGSAKHRASNMIKIHRLGDLPE